MASRPTVPAPPRAAAVRVRVKGTGIYVDPPRMDAAGMDAPGLAGAAAPPPAFAGSSTSGRLRNWRTSGLGPNAMVSAEAPEMVRRARDHIRNAGPAKRAVSLLGAHIVGTGIVPQPQCRDAGLAREIRELWDLSVDEADADGAYDFYGLTWQACVEMVSGGDAFARMRPRAPADRLLVPLQLQLLPAEMVPLSYGVPHQGNEVIQGVERSVIGKRVAYWMHRRHPGDGGASFGMPQTMSVQPIRVPADGVLHLRSAPAGQLRGLPWLHAALTSIKYLNDWRDAALLRKQIVTMLVGFIRKAVGSNMTAEELAAAWGEVRKELGGDVPLVSLEPGTMQYLEPGEEVEFTNWQETAGQDEVFLRTTQMGIATSLDLIYEELTGDWKNANDRTWRANFNTFKRLITMHQHHLLVFQWCRPWYSRWLDTAVAVGAITPPRGTAEHDLKRCIWIPQRWDYINPKQDIDAEAAEVAGGFASRASKIRARGDNPDDVDRERATDQQREQRLGIAAPSRPAGPAPVLPDDEDPPQDDQP